MAAPQDTASRKRKQTLTFMLHDPATMANTGKYNSTSHRNAALKAANKGFQTILLRQTNTKTIYQYEGSVVKLDEPKQIARGDRFITYAKKPVARFLKSYQYEGLDEDEHEASEVKPKARAKKTEGSEPACEPEPVEEEKPKPKSFCDAAEHLLLSKHIPYEKRVVAKPRLVEVSGRVTYPQLFDEAGGHVGGFGKARDRLDEPMLDASMSRFSPIPVVHLDIWRMYKEAQAVNWVAEEIDYSTDVQQWLELTPDQQHFLKHVLAFFNGADGIVQENLMTNFVLEVQYPEARQFYVHQAYVESVHAETYGLLLSSYVAEEKERDRLVNAILTTPSVRAKALWARKWMDPSQCFAQRLIAFICVEGVMFSASFCAIFWMKQRGLLPALTLSNDFIARDEGMHQRFGVLLYNDHLRHRLGETEVHQIVSEAVDTEVQFVRDAIPPSFRDPHISADSMVEYVKYIADRILLTLDYGALYHASQPFDWMESISLRGFNNFFEKRSEMYRDAKVRVEQAPDAPVFTMDDIEF